MAKPCYIFDNTQDRRERIRLKIIEQHRDPATRRRLLATGLRPGWYRRKAPFTRGDGGH